MNRIVRLLCESSNNSTAVSDSFTSARPFWWRGSSVEFQLALSSNGSFLTADDIGTLILEIKSVSASETDDNLIRLTFGSDDCDAAFTADDWTAGTGALVSAVVPYDDAALAPGQYRIIVRHEALDGSRDTYLRATVEVVDDQSESPSIATPPTPAVEYYTKEESDSRFKTENTINVTSYGADATGATDSTSAIHAAIAIAQASGRSAAVYFPAGTYKCNLDISGHCKLFGDGVTNMGDWTGADTGKTVLVPNSNASPVIRFTTIRASSVRGFEVRGNGAGTSVAGIEINSPGGFRMDDVIVRRFTSGLKSNRGCNFSATQCGFFQCNKNVWLNDIVSPTSYAHSYYFEMCSLGGVPASGNGRCVELDGSPFVSFHTCEIGNCYDVLKANSNGAIVNFVGSNFETFSTAGALIEVGNCAVNFLGHRFGMSNAVIVRSDSTATVTNTGCRDFGSGNKLCQHTGQAAVTSNQGMTVEEYTDNTYGTLVGASTTAKIVVAARRTSDQAIPSATQTVIVFNTEESDLSGKYDNATGIFKPGKRGMYSVSASARLSAIGGSDVQMRFLRNGSEILTPVRVTTGSAATTICGSGTVYLDANDELSVAIYAAGSLTVQAGSNYATTLSIFEI